MVGMSSFHVRTMVVGLLLSNLSTLAFAQQPSQAQASAIKQSCRSDYQANCSSVPAGGRASLQCLQQHLSDLSPACQSAVNEASGGGSAHPPAAASQATAGRGAHSNVAAAKGSLDAPILWRRLPRLLPGRAAWRRSWPRLSCREPIPAVSVLQRCSGRGSGVALNITT